MKYIYERERERDVKSNFNFWSVINVLQRFSCKKVDESEIFYTFYDRLNVITSLYGNSESIVDIFSQGIKSSRQFSHRPQSSHKKTSSVLRDADVAFNVYCVSAPLSSWHPFSHICYFVSIVLSSIIRASGSVGV